jgi:hypothetical protein
MQRLKIKVIAAAIGVVAGISFSIGAHAQSLSGIRVGEGISSTSKIDAKLLPTKVATPHAERRWKLPDGNRLSLATDPETGNRIVYLEERWGGGANGRPTDFPGFTYGQTTLADIRARAENNGFAFRERLIDERPDGLALFNAYEVEGSPNLVVTFVTKLSKKDVDRLRTDKGFDLNGAARLDSIILAYAGYLDAIWGEEKLKGKGYKPIRWDHPSDVALRSR